MKNNIKRIFERTIAFMLLSLFLINSYGGSIALAANLGTGSGSGVAGGGYKDTYN